MISALVRFTDYLSGHLDKMLGVILRWTNILSRGAAMLLISPCHEIWDTFRPCGPIWP